jgi:hypothetical protein
MGLKADLIGGFDPGKKGAFVTIDVVTGKIVKVCRVPLIKHTQKHRAPRKPTVTTEIDWPTLCGEWTPFILRCRRIYLEHIWGATTKGRKDGSASAFKLGYAAGVPFGIVLSHVIPYHFVTPQVWKKLLNYPPKPEGVESWKEPSFDLARSFFPDSVKEFERVTVDEGVAEAALIAYVGRQFLEQTHA